MNIEAATRVAGFNVTVGGRVYRSGTTTRDRGSKVWNRACSATKLKSNGMRSGQSMQTIAVQGFTAAKGDETFQERITCNVIGQVDTAYKYER